MEHIYIHTHAHIYIYIYKIVLYICIYIYPYIPLIIEYNGDVSPEKKRRICHQIDFFSPDGNFATQTIFIIIFRICTCRQLLIPSITLQLDFTLLEYKYLL